MLFGRSIHFWLWSVKIPYYNCVAVNIFPEVLQDFPYVFGCSYVGCIYIYNVYVFLVASSLEYYEVTFWVPFYGTFFWSLPCLIWILLPGLLFPFPFIWNICFQVFTFSLCRSFVLRWVSCRQHMCGLCFLIHSFILCVGIGARNSFTFNVIIDRYLFIAIFSLYLCYSLHFFLLLKAIPLTFLAMLVWW